MLPLAAPRQTDIVKKNRACGGPGLRRRLAAGPPKGIKPWANPTSIRAGLRLRVLDRAPAATAVMTVSAKRAFIAPIYYTKAKPGTYAGRICPGFDAFWRARR